MSILRAIFRHTLNSVIFGIAIMVLVGAYIAIGSGLPSVREALEMTDLQFFNAWPLKVLMLLLVLNLSTVTWMRIPLTLPRLGVWMIHSGIVTLIIGTSFYYRFKVEGQIPIRQGQTVTGFYDASERSLYVRENGQTIPTELRLQTLPRFKSYPAGESDGAFGPDLKNIKLAGVYRDETGKRVNLSVADMIGLKNDLTVDVIGYHPYAQILSDFEPAAEGGVPGIHLTMPNPHGNQVFENWVVSDDPQYRTLEWEGIVFEHRQLPPADAAALVQAGKQIHHIDAKIGDFSQSLFVQVGNTYALGSTGYSFTVERFNPAFPMFGTNEMVRTLTLLVNNSNPGGVAHFRRMILEGKSLQTDFKLDAPGAGPMGKRQKAPLDEKLQLSYSFNDPYHLVTNDGLEHHLLVTTDQPGISHVIVNERGEVSAGEISPTGEFVVGPSDVQLTLKAERVDHVKRTEHVEDIPSVQRQREVGQSGARQVLTVRLKCGDWSRVLNLPFLPFAMEPQMEWDAARPIEVPGTPAKIQLAFGFTHRELPAKLTLEKFELVNYAGGTQSDSLFRDFKSTLQVVNRATGEQTVGVAHMNNPIYFDHGDWLFFQSGFNKDQMSTVIGVGNRPGVGVMVSGCILMAVGLLYAFYLKPIIIRRRKVKAIAEAKAAGKLKSTQPKESAAVSVQ